MKILITGINGMLGEELHTLLAEDHEVVGLSRGAVLPSGQKSYQVDITDQQAVYQTISRVNPDVVIHAAGMTNVDECERDPDAAFRVNSLGTRNIAIACQRFDTVVCYMSTDYAFSGVNAPESGYTEFDAPDPVSVYAHSKVMGENYVTGLLNKYFIVRTAWLFGAGRTNFVTQNALAFKEQRTIKAAADMVSSPTSVKDLADALAGLIATTRFGTYHLTNSGFASRYDIACAIADMMRVPRALVEKVSVKDLHLPAPRPSFSGLRNYVRELDNQPPLRPWKQAVKGFLLEQKLM